MLNRDGPWPVLFLYFLGWHGLLSVVFLWFTVRRLALAGRRRRLAMWSALLGLVWGIWSTNYWRADTIAEQAAENRVEEGLWDLGRWPVSKFALYAFGFTALAAGCHWLLGFVWPADWKPSRGWSIAVAALLVAFLGLWTAAVPYAPVKFGAIVGLLVWLLHRSRPVSGVDGLLARNTGRVQPVNLLPLVCMPVGAVGSYALMTALDVADPVLDTIYWTVVAATCLGGALGLLWGNVGPARPTDTR